MLKTKKYSRGIGNLTAYLQARGSTFAFVAFLIAGLAGGSFFALGGAEGGELIRSIVQSELSLQLERSLLQLLMSSASGAVGILIFAYLCVNCSKGAILVYIIPLVHGSSMGAFISTTLYLYGLTALGYIAVCFFLPKLLETLLLLSLCNKSSRYCKEQFGGQAPRHKSREVFPIWLYLLLFVVYFAVESLIVFTFRWLL